MIYLTGSTKHVPELKIVYFLIILCLAVQHITMLIETDLISGASSRSKPFPSDISDYCLRESSCFCIFLLCAESRNEIY